MAGPRLKSFMSFIINIIKIFNNNIINNID